MEESWQAAARGIPVWIGCLEMDGGRVDGFTEHGIVNVRQRGMIGSSHPAASGPDLADSDTRAAYDRRLAVALGVAETVANDGVIVFYLPNIGDWFMGAGWCEDDGDFAWSRRFQEIDTDDALMFRALAWPADKRVKS